MFMFKKTGTSFSNVAVKIKTITAKQIAAVGRKDLIQTTEDYGWKRFKSSIKQASVDKDTEMVFINDTKNSKAIAGYLSGGTSSHFVVPKKKKALHWGGKPGFFSKGHFVKGIKAFNWWGYTNSVQLAVNNFVKEKFKSAFK